MSTASFEAFYKAALEEIGLPLGDDDRLELRAQQRVPPALQAWYFVGGRSWLNSEHNRVLGPSDLRDSGDKVVFAEENQQVVVWAFDRFSTADDPEVWQGQPAGDPVHWYPEDLSLSRFLIDMFHHTVADDDRVE